MLIIGGALLVLFMKAVLIVTGCIFGLECSVYICTSTEVIFVCSGLITHFYRDKGAIGCFNWVVFVP